MDFSQNVEYDNDKTQQDTNANVIRHCLLEGRAYLYNNCKIDTFSYHVNFHSFKEMYR